LPGALPGDAVAMFGLVGRVCRRRSVAARRRPHRPHLVSLPGVAPLRRRVRSAATVGRVGRCRVGGSWPRPPPDYPPPSARRPAEPRPAAVLVRVDAGFCRAPTQVCVVRGRSAPRLDVQGGSATAAEEAASGKPGPARAPNMRTYPRLSTQFNKVAVPPAGNESALWNGPVPPRSGQYVSCLSDAKGGHAGKGCVQPNRGRSSQKVFGEGSH